MGGPTKYLKWITRGGATVFIPFVTFPVLSSVWGYIGLGAALQCGILLKIPLIAFWFQTLIAWGDEIFFPEG
ncbi:hypothetical protein HQ533_03635 [Candidatus Woesearchaeota archaeon]|nr:hypothetical protein [Candidatus Woesearchaeota archaeon]